VWAYNNQESISTLKFRIDRNNEYIENNINKCYYTSEKIRAMKYNYKIYYGDRFFYYPEFVNSSCCYKVKRNNKVNKIMRFDFYIDRCAMGYRNLDICSEVEITCEKTTESLSEIKRRYYCIETELNDSIVIRENLLKEKEASYASLIAQKEVSLGYII
jgi:hypothetical protein